MSETVTKPVGAFSWNELMTTDIEAAKAFYSALFGWRTQDIKCDGKAYTMAAIDDQDVAGIMAIPREAVGMPPCWGAYVTVADVDALLPRAKKLGGKVIVPPQNIPDIGRFAVIQDPQGAMLSVIAYLK